MNANIWDFDLDMINFISANSCLTEYSSRIFLDLGGAKSVFGDTAVRCLMERFRSTSELNYAEMHVDLHSLFSADYYCRCYKSVPGSAVFKKVDQGFSMHCRQSNIL